MRPRKKLDLLVGPSVLALALAGRPVAVLVAASWLAGKRRRRVGAITPNLVCPCICVYASAVDRSRVLDYGSRVSARNRGCVASHASLLPCIRTRFLTQLLCRYTVCSSASSEKRDVGCIRSRPYLYSNRLC
jgi:hypothetical protein